MEQNVGTLLLHKGRTFYQWGKTGFASLLGGIIISLVAGIFVLLGSISGYFGAVYILVALFGFCGAVMLVGGVALIPLYFFGLHYMGLGQLNQYGEALCQNAPGNSEYMPHDLPEL